MKFGQLASELVVLLQQPQNLLLPLRQGPGHDIANFVRLRLIVRTLTSVALVSGNDLLGLRVKFANEPAAADVFLVDLVPGGQILIGVYHPRLLLHVGYVPCHVPLLWVSIHTVILYHIEKQSNKNMKKS